MHLLWIRNERESTITYGYGLPRFPSSKPSHLSLLLFQTAIPLPLFQASLEIAAMTLHQPPLLSPFFIACRGRLLLFTLFTAWFANLSVAYQDFICGEHVLHYPFGRKNSGHGDFSLQLECDHEHRRPKPVLDISGKKYYILLPKLHYNFSFKFNHTMGGTMTIIDKKLRDNCDPSSNNYTELRASSQFRIADTHINIILGGRCGAGWTDLPNHTASLECNTDWHYNLTAGYSWPEVCKAHAVLPVNSSGGPVDDHQIMHGGFPIEWIVSKCCGDCQSSGGFCGYNSSSMQFHCGCRGRHIPYPDRCPAGKIIASCFFKLTHKS